MRLKIPKSIALSSGRALTGERALPGRLHALAKVVGAKAKKTEGRDRHEVCSEFDELRDARSVARRVAAHANELAARPDPRNDLAHELPHRRRAGIAHALPKIAGRYVQYVDARHLEDCVEIAHSFGLFDHGNHKQLRVDPSSRFVPRRSDAVVMGASPRGHSPVAVRMVARRPGHAFGDLSGVDVWNDDALYATIEKAEDCRVFVVVNPGDGRDAEHLGRSHHVLDIVQTHRPVLAVDHDEVVSDRSEQLDQIRRMTADDRAEHHLAFGKLRFCRIGAHGSPRFGVLSVTRSGQLSSAATASISISASGIARFEICTSVLAGGLGPKNSERTSPYASR